MSNERVREYHAMIWTKDSTQPGKRVKVLATSREEAKNILKAEYGEENIFLFQNEDDSNSLR